MSRPEDNKESIEDEGRILVRMCQDLRVRVNELEDRIDANLDRYMKATQNGKADDSATN